MPTTPKRRARWRPPRTWCGLLPTPSPTGFLHVREATVLAGSGNNVGLAFESAYVEGRERGFKPFDSAEEAALDFARFSSDLLERAAAAAASAERAEQLQATARDRDRSAARAAAEAKSAAAAAAPPSTRIRTPRARRQGRRQRRVAARRARRAIVYDETLVGRRVRALFEEEDGEWYDGSIVDFIPSKKRMGKPKYTVRYDNEEVEEVTLPDDTIKLLPVGRPGDPPPPLTKEDERRSYKAQAAIEEKAARAEIDEHQIQLFLSDRTSTGYRCVYEIQLKLGVWSYEAIAERNGKKIHLGRYKSKLGAAYAFAVHMQGSGADVRAGGRKKDAYGNMLIPQALPESMEGGTVNTIEKVLDFRDVDVQMDVAEAARYDAENESYVVRRQSRRRRHRQRRRRCRRRYSPRCRRRPRRRLLLRCRRARVPRCTRRSTTAPRAQASIGLTRAGAASVGRRPTSGRQGRYALRRRRWPWVQQPGRLGRRAAAAAEPLHGAGRPRVRADAPPHEADAAAVAVGVPYEVGIVKRTKASLATSMQRQPDDEFAREQRAVLDELAADAERHGAADIAAILDPSLFVELAREAEEAERNKKKKAPATAAAQARGGTAGGAVVKAEVGRPPADPGPVGMVVTAVLTEDVGGAVAAEQDAGDDDVVAFEVVQPGEADGGAIAAVVVDDENGADAQGGSVAMVVEATDEPAAVVAPTGGVVVGVAAVTSDAAPPPQVWRRRRRWPPNLLCGWMSLR